MTNYAEIVGNPVIQSKSPLIHGFWLDRLGIAADYRATQIVEGALDEYISERRSDTDWLGCNVTMPHKRRIVAHLDDLDPLAKQTDAVNTVVRRPDGSLRGFNTDIAGFLEPLAPVLAKQHLFRMARVIGTGGAARAVVAALAANNFAIVLAGRDPNKARAILDAIDPTGEHHTPLLSHFAEATDFVFDDRKGCCDLVVNASPLGMAGKTDLHFDLSHAPPGSLFYDIVTHPVETRLLNCAKAAGFETIDGLAMLIGQAAKAFALLFGTEAPRDHDAELRALLTQ